MSKYKTFDELKEELKDKFEEYMYNANIELLEKVEKGGYCELKKKCDDGLCDCTNEEYNTMCESNMRLSLENEELQQRIDKVIDFIDNWKKYKKDKGSLEVSMLDLLYIKEILGGNE